VDADGRRLLGVAAAFVAVAGIVWLVLSVVLAAAAFGITPALWAEVLRVGGPPAVVAVVAAIVAGWSRR
jgi:uncharacterized membrane protein